LPPLLLLLLQLQGSKVAVSIAYPADINTPGYAKENLNKVRGRQGQEGGEGQLAGWGVEWHAACWEGW
jgi:hypothetical protein